MQTLCRPTLQGTLNALLVFVTFTITVSLAITVTSRITKLLIRMRTNRAHPVLEFLVVIFFSSVVIWMLPGGMACDVTVLKASIMHACTHSTVSLTQPPS